MRPAILFHLISAAIALPVVAYSGQPFFQNAWSGPARAPVEHGRADIAGAPAGGGHVAVTRLLNSGAHAYFDAALSLTFFLLIGRYIWITGPAVRRGRRQRN